MARRIIIRLKQGDKVEMERDLLVADTGEFSYMQTPLYSNPTYTIEGNFDFEIEELRDYVQVEFINKLRGAAAMLYTYIDPGLNLKVGDLVDVPSRFGDNNFAIVRKLGADNVDLANFIVKEVSARYAKITADEVEAADEPEFTNDDYACFCGDPECYG